MECEILSVDNINTRKLNSVENGGQYAVLDIYGIKLMMISYQIVQNLFDQQIIFAPYTRH